MFSVPELPDREVVWKIRPHLRRLRSGRVIWVSGVPLEEKKSEQIKDPSAMGYNLN